MQQIVSKGKYQNCLNRLQNVMNWWLYKQLKFDDFQMEMTSWGGFKSKGEEGIHSGTRGEFLSYDGSI